MLIQQINRHANLSSHQMDAVLAVLHHLKWGPKMGPTQTEIAARCEPHPHDKLRDAVVDAACEARKEWSVAEGTFGAEEYHHRQKYWKARDAIFAAVDALTAALAPPDPAKELRAAMAAVSMIGPSDAAARLEAAIDGAIAALRKGAGT